MIGAAVFLGPSFDPRLAAETFDVEILPPVGRGDIDALLVRADPPSVIGIVDGRFLHDLAISPKEVLRALDRRIQVFGAASMGALRAVELEPFGMIGVGRVYEMFASGDIDDDDEVAITYDPETARALSEPMVNIRVAVAAAVEQGVIPPTLGTRYVDAAKSLYFPDRRHSAVLAALGDQIETSDRDRLAHFFATEAPVIKREDAIALLIRVQGYLE